MTDDAPPPEIDAVLESMGEQIAVVLSWMAKENFEELSWSLNDTHELVIREHPQKLRSIQ